MTLTRITALAGDTILSLADAKEHLRVVHDDEDILIGSLRNSAVSHVERISGVALASGSWSWAMRCFPARVDLPIGPVTAIDTVSYLDGDGVAQTYDDARLIDGSVYPASGGTWPTAYDSVTVEFTAGLTSAAEAPELLAAVKLVLGHLYENREAVSAKAMGEVPLGVDSLISTHLKVMV